MFHSPRSSRRVALALAATAFIACRAGAQTTPEPFKDGDRWCAVGDSITHSGRYHPLVWLYYLTRFPDRTIENTNAGISGDTTVRALNRLHWDVLPLRPTVATVMFGMNDVGRPLYNDPATPELEAQRRERISIYKDSQRSLVKALQDKGVRVVLVTPSMFDQTVDVERPKQTGVAEALGECAEYLKTLGAEVGAPVIDLYGPMMRLNAERQKADPKFTVVGADRVHPGPSGHLLMAYLFLRAQGVPADVARLTIDAKKKRVVSAVNGTAAKVERRKSEVSFEWKANALPFPVPEDAAAALEWVPFMDELNQEVLQVTGLEAGRYELRIDDDAPLGPYTVDELAAGINLAAIRTTPQYRQALVVAEVVEKRRVLIAEKLRSLALVEHRTLPDASSHPVTFETMKPLIADQLELFKTKPPAPSIQKAIEAYLELKPGQGAAFAEAEKLAAEARALVKLVPRRYRLVRAE